MKPFQFYQVSRFPKLKAGEKIATQFQLTFSGEGEDVQTRVVMERPDFEGPLDLLRIESQIKHETVGFIKRTIEQERKRFDFFEYLEPVDFPAYHATQKKIIIFQASKRSSRGVLANLRRNTSQIELVEMQVDFVKVLGLIEHYQGAWFRKLSSNIHAAGLHGDEIQRDALFKKMLHDGELSNVTVPWELFEAEHRVMITANGAIVLIQDYKGNIGVELGIVMDVYDRLLSKVWSVKKTRGHGDDIPVEP